LKKQIGVKPHAVTPNKCRHISKAKKIPICVRRTERRITLPPAHRPYTPQGTLNFEPVNTYVCSW
jgi:hypothetical protein